MAATQLRRAYAKIEVDWFTPPKSPAMGPRHGLICELTSVSGLRLITSIYALGFLLWEKATQWQNGHQQLCFWQRREPPWLMVWARVLGLTVTSLNWIMCPFPILITEAGPEPHLLPLELAWGSTSPQTHELRMGFAKGKEETSYQKEGESKLGA